MSLLLLLAPAAAQVATTQPVIAVLTSRQLLQYTAAFKSFKNTLASQGISPNYVFFDLNGGKEEHVRLIENIRLLNPQLIFSIGTLATAALRDHITTTPVVFSMVLNPVESSLVKSMDSSGNNITGAALDISVSDQFRTLRTILPGIKKVGVIYNPEETIATIAEATRSARELGMELIAVPINRESDLPRALEEIKAYKVDCLWAVSDSMVFSSFKSIQFFILFALQNRLPFVGLSSSFVKFGALMAFFDDSENNGARAGKIAQQILAGAKPSLIPIAAPKKISLSINTRVAAQIGIIIPSDIIAAAKEVYK
ncbi:MAG: ABC transporter substrate-binding protein [Elusimicrobia bacterium]|nr:ABC transporter substrate-binding protein [Elusimicrobiota bacterium]